MYRCVCIKLTTLAIIALLFTCPTLLVAQGIYQLWGATYIGGTSNQGVIFSAHYNGTTIQKQVDLATAIGSNATGQLTLYNGKLYGLTNKGGAFDQGTLFEYDLLTKAYVKRIDLNTTIGSQPLGNRLTVYNNKLYGVTASGGATDAGVLFEYDPATFTYSKKVDFSTGNGSRPAGGLIVFNNELYGLTDLGGSSFSGVLYKYDPATSTYTKLHDFGGSNGSFPSGSLILYNNKLYGVTIGGGALAGGVIFEYDPVALTYTVKHHLNPSNGSYSYGGLTLYNNDLYGMYEQGGAFNGGGLFKFNLATNLYTKIRDFDNATGNQPTGGLIVNNNRLYGITSYGDKGLIAYHPTTGSLSVSGPFTVPNNYSAAYTTLTPVPAPVAAGTTGSCQALGSVTINADNANEWVAITDAQGDAVAEIYANGNNLGTVAAQLYVHNSTVRKDASGRFYLGRNITITPQFQPATPVSIRLYIKENEYTLLRNTSNASGLFSTISSINDIGVFKSDGTCANHIVSYAVPITGSSATSWGLHNDYVFTASVSSFSTFYFSSKQHTSLPIQLISFTATVKDQTAVLQWSAKEDSDSKQYEVEYGNDGKNYSTITTIKANGSPVSNTYQYIHPRLLAGTHYYRIKMIDQDGTYSYSSVRTLRIGSASKFSMQLQSNPVAANPVLQLTALRPQSLQLTIYNNSGQRLWQRDFKFNTGSHVFSLPVSLPSGYYMLSANNMEEEQRVKFIQQ